MNQATDEEVVVTERQQRGFYLKSARILGTGPDGSRLYEIRAEHAEEQLRRMPPYRGQSMPTSQQSCQTRNVSS
jgi:hypothetical protein